MPPDNSNGWAPENGDLPPRRDDSYWDVIVGTPYDVLIRALWVLRFVFVVPAAAIARVGRLAEWSSRNDSIDSPRVTLSTGTTPETVDDKAASALGTSTGWKAAKRNGTLQPSTPDASAVPDE